MEIKDRFQLRVAEVKERISQMKQELEDAKEKAFAEHELMLQSEIKDREAYESACEVREQLREELLDLESYLNKLLAMDSDSKPYSHEMDRFSGSPYSRDLLNLAMAILGLCAGLIIAKLF